ncbi:MAG: TIGR00282 family metallophosphoesterase [Alphaproteobacteria bacterium]|nr:TIGR00282 family metallophosphoesterase [Rhodobiaceae bacterium]PDH50642.1 MAG: TIGR00282 family metallophosphoesterase [alpha proteobacterium MED-G09]
MRILFLGDVVGRSAREAVIKEIPEIRRNFSIDFVIVNGENAAGGFGITEKICEDFFSSGIDCITTGNHVWDQKELFDYIKNENRLLRPINYPEETPGKGFEIFPNQLGRVLVVNVMGRLFMESLDDPFNAIEKVLDENPLGITCDAIVIDIHAETTSEKTAMGHFCDGRVSLVVGTHTHIPTADYQILPYGTGYQTDAGMCGDYDSVIGMEKTEPIRRFVEKTPGGRFNPAQGSPTLCGVIIETSPDGLSETIEPFRLGGILSQTKK